MALAAFTVTDDDGSGTTGTAGTNAWLQTLLDLIDGRWSALTTTSTGSQHNLSITSSGIEADVLFCNNASDLTLTGIAAPASPAKPGKCLVVIAGGAGNVFLTHNSGSSSVGNKLINFVTSGLTPLAAGKGRAVYRYDAAVNSAWVLIHHEQGACITPTFSAGNYTSDAGSWTVASGDVTTQQYYVRGDQVFVSWDIVTTTVSGTPALLILNNGLFGGFTTPKSETSLALGSNNGGSLEVCVASTVATSTGIFIAQLDAGTWTNATNTTRVAGEKCFKVT